MAREIIWTATAAYQRRQVLGFWKQRNKSNAYPKKLVKLINDRLHLISEYPFLGRKTNYSNLRVHTLGDYNIYFKVNENSLVICIFWDNRRNPNELLEQLNNIE